MLSTDSEYSIRYPAKYSADDVDPFQSHTIPPNTTASATQIATHSPDSFGVGSCSSAWKKRRSTSNIAITKAMNPTYMYQGTKRPPRWVATVGSAAHRPPSRSIDAPTSKDSSGPPTVPAPGVVLGRRSPV